MSTQKIKTRFIGVYYRETKRNLTNNEKPDICYYITYKINGKKYWEKIGCKSMGYTPLAANEIRINKLKDFVVGSEYAPRKKQKRLILDEAWEVYRDRRLVNLCRQGADDAARYTIYIKPHFGLKPLDKIAAGELEDFKYGLLKTLAPATVVHILGNIRQVYNRMKDWDMYDGPNPVSKVKMPKVDNARSRYLTKEEAEELMNDLKRRKSISWEFAAISLFAGLRLGEILALRWSDVDLTSCTIHVRDAKAGTRMAHFAKNLKVIFMALQARQSHNLGDLVFPDRNGNMRKSTHTNSTFFKAVEHLNLNKGITDTRQKVVFHTLRHTFASWLAIQGVPLYTVGKLMGHSSVEMTQRYAHLSPDVNREAIEKIKDIIKL